jgi:hypothetical protein
MKGNKVLLSVLLFTSLAWGQEGKMLSKAIGFAGGLISGSGFSYRKIDEKGGYQINGGLVGWNRNETLPAESDLWYSDYVVTEYAWNMYINGNVGVNLYKTLRKAEKSTLYLLCGSAIYIDAEEETSRKHQYGHYISPEKNTWDTNLQVNAGAGFGFEYHITENIHLALEWPLTLSIGGETDFQIIMYIPQGGIHYYFE